MSDISLTASMRSNLLSLQNTQSLMDQTQDRLSTGKKVNSAIDNPSSYYTAQSLTNRASDLESLLDSMGQGIQTIQAANEGIESITAFVEQAKAVANTARDTSMKSELKAGKAFAKFDGDVTVKLGDKEYTVTFEQATQTDATAAATKLNNDAGSGLKTALEEANLQFANDGSGNLVLKAKDTSKEVEKVAVSVSGNETVAMSGTVDPNARDSSIKQFNEILEQIDQLAADASYKGVNLLKDGESLKIVFNEDRSSSITVEGKSADTTGLGLSAVSAEDWATNEGVDETISAIEGAVSKLRDMASEFGNNYSIVQTRQDFTENLINVLEEGADNLTLADMNEESANMLALQTRQQLAINSLSLASQAAQSVLSLF